MAKTARAVLIILAVFVYVFFVACATKAPTPTAPPEKYREVVMEEGVNFELSLQTPPDSWTVRFLCDDPHVLGCFQGEALADFVVPGWNHFGPHVFYAESAKECEGWRILFPKTKEHALQ